MLDRLEIGCTAVTSRDEAVTVYHESIREARRFDAVMIDLDTFGDNEAEELIRGLCRIDPFAMVIISSQTTRNPLMVDYRNINIHKRILKPYTVESLGSVIRELLPNN